MGNTRKKRGQTASRRQAEHPGLRHVNMNNKENQQEEKAQGVTSANMQYPSIMMSREKKIIVHAAKKSLCMQRHGSLEVG